jgi:hypothetical protein
MMRARVAVPAESVGCRDCVSVMTVRRWSGGEKVRI